MFAPLALSCLLLAQVADPAEASPAPAPALTPARLVWDDTGGPEAREHPAILVDAERERVIVFGGSGYAPQLAPLDDLWALDLRTRSWSRVEALGERPAGGGSRRVAQAVGSNEALLFGGYDGQMQPTAELYRVRLGDEGVHFERLQQVDPPPARFLHGFAWDAEGERGVLFGGVGAGLLGDTWFVEVDEGVARWSQLETGAAPSPRYGFAHALDPNSGRFLVAGGADARLPAEVPEDCWVLDLRAEPPSWSPLPEVTLAVGRNACQAFDPTRGTLVVHGGTANGRDVSPGVRALRIGDERPAWRELALPEGSPPRASGAGFAEPGGARVWLGFGNSSAGAFRDLVPIELSGSAGGVGEEPAARDGSDR